MLQCKWLGGLKYIWKWFAWTSTQHFKHMCHVSLLCVKDFSDTCFLINLLISKKRKQPWCLFGYPQSCAKQNHINSQDNLSTYCMGDNPDILRDITLNHRKWTHSLSMTCYLVNSYVQGWFPLQIAKLLLSKWRYWPMYWINPFSHDVPASDIKGAPHFCTVNILCRSDSGCQSKCVFP